jgi:hypothetical protein
LICAIVIAIGSHAGAATIYSNGFETDTSGWNVFGGSLDAVRVPSGTNGIPSASGSYHAENNPTAAGNWGGYNYGAGNAVPTAFKEYWTAVDIYLDVDSAWANDTRFDFDSAINNSSGTFLRDFIFNAGFYNDATGPGANTNRFVISASNNSQPGSAFAKNPDKLPIAISDTGWYTFEHHFYNNGGVLAVDMSIFDASQSLINTWTINTSDAIAGVGGNRYGWFDYNQLSTLAFDNTALNVVPEPGTFVLAAMALAGAGMYGIRRRGKRIAAAPKRLVNCLRVLTLLVAAVALASTAAVAAPFNGVSEFQEDSLGYYYMITGGKFPTGPTPNGDNASTPNGGTFRFVSDDPVVWSRPLAESGLWQKDDWFTANAGFALTLKNGASIVYDNNGIEDSSYGSYYDATGLAASADKPGLYRGYSMSNNYDWIYAGYFKLETETTVSELIGYFDENSGFDRNSPQIDFRMNIWSNVDGDLLPFNTVSFDGDVFSSDSTPGIFATSDTGVDRIFGDDFGNMHDDIFRLSFTPTSALVLPAGEYWFSHDAVIVPEPGSLALAGFGCIGLAVWLGRRRARKDA